MSEALINIRGLEKTSPSVRGCFHVLRRINLVVGQGEFLSVLGPSGAGKTSLLHILGLIDDDWRGSYRYRGCEVTELNRPQRKELQRGQIGVVFQRQNLLGDLSVAENLELPLLYRDRGFSERRRLVSDFLEDFGLSPVLGWRPVRLSSGQRKLVGLARALIARPSLLLVDELTGGLCDSETGGVLQALRRINLQGVTIVQATRAPHVAAVGDRVVGLSEGWLECEPVGAVGVGKGMSV